MYFEHYIREGVIKSYSIEYKSIKMYLNAAIWNGSIVI